jgi:transposase InsO family protein
VLTDNGPAYRSIQFAQACRELGLKHHFTRPYTPRTNGKAERFIQTALREWADAYTYQDSTECSQQLRRRLPPLQLASSPCQFQRTSPISRPGLDRNNLLSHHP